MKVSLSDDGSMVQVELNGEIRFFTAIRYMDRISTIDRPVSGKIAAGGKNWDYRVTVWDNGNYTLSGGLNGKPVKTIVGWAETTGNKSEHTGS